MQQSRAPRTTLLVLPSSRSQLEVRPDFRLGPSRWLPAWEDQAGHGPPRALAKV